MLLAKTIRSPSGAKYGAKFAAPFAVSWRLPDPSAFMTQISMRLGRTRSGEERAVVGDLLGRGRVMRAVDDLHRREERAAVVADLVGQPAHVPAVRVHRVEIEVAVPHRREHDPRTIAAERRLGVVAR